MLNKYLKNAELVRAEIEHILPEEGPIDFNKLNFNCRQLINTPKGISSGIPLSMASLVANYQMANFASQFQFKMNLDGSKIPTNIVGFVLATSGLGKDSTVSAMEEAMAMGYMVIEQEREKKNRESAINKAEQEDGDGVGWQRFYKQPLPLTNAISTVEGLTSRLNQFSRDGIGMPSVYVGELGSELGSNVNMADNIRLISELFDVGNKKSKAIKDSERQDAEVKGMGMNALFVGSEDNIILDKGISQKFKTEFVTKLARRSMFVYPSKEEFESCVAEYSNYETMVKTQEQFELLAREGKAYINSATNDIARTLLDRDSRLLDIADDALTAYKDYKLYTTNLGAGMSFIHKSVQLELTHRSWKMLKLAGVYAIWDMSDEVTVEHITDAIYFVEKIGKYLELYEEYASKESYELLIDFFSHNTDVSLTLHDLKKRGFINGTTGIESRLKELVRLADSFAGSEGTIKFANDVMGYKPFEKVGDHYASYVKVSGSKQERALQCHSGFEAKSTTFKRLEILLQNDTAYTPFRFQNGQRKNDNIISGATWVALDVDDSELTMNEMHDMLDGINHHIATTSNSENPFKYRIIIEFNNIVDLPVREWKAFGRALGQELGINVDPATFTKSQIMFGYKGAKVLSTLGQEPYDISGCVKEAGHNVSEVFNKTKTLSRTQSRTALDNPIDTFNFAFSDKGMKSRSLSLFRMWKYAKDLGANGDECAKLMHDLNYMFWEEPVSDERFEGYITQMRRSFGEED